MLNRLCRLGKLDREQARIINSHCAEPEEALVEEFDTDRDVGRLYVDSLMHLLDNVSHVSMQKFVGMQILRLLRRTFIRGPKEMICDLRTTTGNPRLGIQFFCEQEAATAGGDPSSSPAARGPRSQYIQVLMHNIDAQADLYALERIAKAAAFLLAYVSAARGGCAVLTCCYSYGQCDPSPTVHFIAWCLDQLEHHDTAENIARSQIAAAALAVCTLHRARTPPYGNGGSYMHTAPPRANTSTTNQSSVF